MIIFGASGHAKVVLDIIDSIKESFDFIVDDDRSKTELLGHPIQHTLTPAMEDKKVVIAIGNNLIRKNLAEKIKNEFCQGLIHVSAIISKNVKIAEGSVVMANAVVNSSVKIGSHAIINTSAIVEHDSEIGDFVHISPGAVVTGNVQIGKGTQVGAGATIIPGIRIGKWVTIGAGSVITKDIPDYAVVVGNPGKIIKFNKFKNE